MCINIVEWKSVHWKKISDAYYQVLFSYINSTDNIWNMSDGESGDDDSVSNYHTKYSEIFCFVVSKLWIERDKQINTDSELTGWK